MFKEESTVLRENVPDINLHRYNETCPRISEIEGLRR